MKTTLFKGYLASKNTQKYRQKPLKIGEIRSFLAIFRQKQAYLC